MSQVARRVGPRVRASIAVAAAMAVGLVGVTAMTPATADAPSASKSSPDLKARGWLPAAGRYVVVLTDQPEAAYDGHLTGYPATRPGPGAQFRSSSSETERYRDYLLGRQAAVLSRIGSPTAFYSYTTALSGFAADLSGEQVLALRKMPDVLTIQPDRHSTLDTVHSPKFLGLSGRKGEWAQHGGPAKAGKNVVVGILDSGIWPENPSFAGKARVPHVRGFEGACPAGQRWKKGTCNSKVISARYFVKGVGVQNLSDTEFLSPRDGEGHGSHTASTAAGNHGVRVRIDGQDFGKASGMAPAAYIAAYKVCWTAANPDNTGCYDSDVIGAVNKAVQDGVDVINFSISGTSDNFADPVEVAFFGAASAGVFVAASAGNSGPTASTVAHPSPWVTTVAASTHYLYQGSVVLGNGKSYVGAMISDRAVGKHRIIVSSAAAKDSADPAEAALCYLGTLDPAKVDERIVVCDRGGNDRVEKSLTVKRAGGVGMVLVNTTPLDVDADFHSVPTVHLDVAAGTKVKNYVSAQGSKARASINPNGHDRTPVPQIAPFSSRGPLIAGGGDILKPDVSAPGVSVIAAVAPPFNSGRRWDAYSGTSMASPHVAGLGAFIRHLRPTWTPAIIKSAMMTTAYDLDGDHSPFAQGAGHVNPRKFLDPGLAYDAASPGWLNFLTGSRKASNVNQASIAIGDLTGTERVARTVTNVSDKKETYRATVRGMKGIDVDVQPSVFSVAAGKVRKFKVTLTAEPDARFKRYATGTLVWKGSEGHVVRSPLVVRPVAVAVTEEVAVNSGTASGSTRISGKAGYSGPLDLEVVGMDGAVPAEDTVAQGELLEADTVRVPAGTSVARFDLDAEDNADDLDLYVVVDGVLVASAETGAGDEQVTLKNPDAGRYQLYVGGFADADGGGSPFALTSWVVPPRDQGNLTVSPDPVRLVLGERFRYTARWNGLDVDRRWFGLVKYSGLGQRTYVTVN